MLIGARVVQAVGGALQAPSGLALVLAAAPPARHQMAIGIWGAAGALAAAAGPTLGALLVEAFGWRAVFLINIPIIGVALVLGGRWLPDTPPSPGTDDVDLVSVPLAGVGVGARAAEVGQRRKVAMIPRRRARPARLARRAVQQESGLLARRRVHLRERKHERRARARRGERRRRARAASRRPWPRR